VSSSRELLGNFPLPKGERADISGGNVRERVELGFDLPQESNGKFHPLLGIALIAKAMPSSPLEGEEYY
jgi:hypothetical protein